MQHLPYKRERVRSLRSEEFQNDSSNFRVLLLTEEMSIRHQIWMDAASAAEIDIQMYLFIKRNTPIIFRAEELFTETATHHFMNGSVEAIVLCEDQQNDKSHVNVVRIPFFNVIQNFKNRQNL